MKYKAKYSRVWDNDVKPIQKQPQPTLYTCEELCSIQPYVLNNSTKLQNICNFQQQTREALQNSQIDEAFKVVKKYVEENKNKFIRFYDIETEKIIIGKQLCRFDEAYILQTKKKLSQLKNISGGQDIMHITLTLQHSENSDYIKIFIFSRKSLGNLFNFSEDV